MSYAVGFLPAARAALRKLDRPVRERLHRAIDALAEDPRPPGAKKLATGDLWRIRVGDWRIVYRIEDDRLLVLVVRIGHRGDVYRAR